MSMFFTPGILVSFCCITSCHKISAAHKKSAMISCSCFGRRAGVPGFGLWVGVKSVEAQRTGAYSSHWRSQKPLECNELNGGPQNDMYMA